MQTHELVAHPDHPPAGVAGITVGVNDDHAHWLTVRWRIEGGAGLVLPDAAGKRRADGLWQTTCFELFLKPDGGKGYVEFNLSPSERWNAYAFDAYRDGMREHPASHAPTCTMRPGSKFAIFDAAIPRSLLPNSGSAMGVSAVIEEEGGAKSYWALAQPADGPPDFHAAPCFAARLEAPTRP